MKTRIAGWFHAVLWIVWAAAAHGGQPEGLTDDMRQRLARDGFCIGSERIGMNLVYFRDGSTPIFITTDSVLAKFHWLMRETVVRRDAVLAKVLLDDLKRAWDKLEHMTAEEPGADPVVCHAAMTRAKIVCGTSIRLLDPSWRAMDPVIGHEIEGEALRVEEAKERIKPSWLGKPEPCFTAIDYTSCKPVGLHAKALAQARYFRTLRFLQMVPFRLARKEELYSACYIIFALRTQEGEREPPPVISPALRKRQEDAAFREGFGPMHPIPGEPCNWLIDRSNDILDWINRENESIALPAFSSPGLLFDRMEPGKPPLRGLLGDSMAYQKNHIFYPGKCKTPLVNNLISTMHMPSSECDSRMIAPLSPADSVLFQRVTDKYIKSADELPDPLLVAAFLGDTKAKTQIAGKYPGFLQSFNLPKPNRIEYGVPDEEAPERLFDSYYEALHCLLGAPDANAPRFMRGDAWHIKSRQTALASWTRMRNCFALEVPPSMGLGGGPTDYPGFVEPCPEFYQRLGRIAYDMGNHWHRVETGVSEIAPAWYSFSLLCARLESLAHKQLRGIDANNIDRKFYGEYAYQLLHGCDDSPRPAAVASAPASGKTLIVAAGWNRVLWVNYPWHGKNHLCRGGVMTFQSFSAPGPMTDEELEARLEASP